MLVSIISIGLGVVAGFLLGDLLGAFVGAALGFVITAAGSPFIR